MITVPWHPSRPRSRTRRLRSALSSAVVLAWALAGAGGATATTTTLVPAGSVWQYLDDGSNQGTAWSASGFDSSAWAAGPAQLGYGDGDEATVVGYGPNANAKHITTYFRTTFAVSTPSRFVGLTLRLVRDDGAVVYLNGTEVFRSNMPAGPIGFATLAPTAVSGAAESQFFSTTVSPGLLVDGNNVLAVEIHQSGGTSSDISFDLELSGTDHVLRGPYLQMGTPTSVVVRWRTDIATDSRVRYGTSPENLAQTADVAVVTTEHVVPLSGLAPDTTYYYAVGSSSEVLAGGDSDHVFVTPPLTGTAKPTRVWVVGDSGTADSNAAAVRDAYDVFAGSHAADLWLMLGDNAYNSGTDSEYQAAVFDMYPAHLRTTVLWPTFGNHDGASADSATQTGPYYDIFTLPAQAQAGGVPSGTEAYYSFDYGNVHFICLDSQESSRAPNGAMLTWLSDDLQATDADWIIAFWHHPPYSKGSHNSDTESQLIDMRQNVLPILEGHGVDLVLTGHSHSYERSVLVDGHYGVSATLTGNMILDGGDGRLDGTGAYAKATLGAAPHEGAVYVVAGSSGQISGGSLNHPVMYLSLNTLGSLVVDVNHNVLHATFIDSTAGVADYFTMLKGDAVCGNGLKDAAEACDQSDLGGATCAAHGCSGGVVSCTLGCTLDYSACSGCEATTTPTPTTTMPPTTTPTVTPSPTATRSPTDTPSLTASPSQTPVPPPTATPTVSPSHHDTVLLQIRPVTMSIRAGASAATKNITVKVRNADIVPGKEQPGHVVRVTVGLGDCPAGTVIGAPDFALRTPGDQSTILVPGGKTKAARVRLRVTAADHVTTMPLAPTRCTLLLSATADLDTNQDPTPRNNAQALELNIADATDLPSAATHESVVRSPRPVSVTVRRGSATASKTVTLALANADAAEAAGHPIQASVSSAGDCPVGTVTVVAPDTVNPAGGTSTSVRLTVQVSAAQFTAANVRSPDRCTAVIEAASSVPGNVEPDPSNNTTRLVIDVNDKNDY